MVGAKRCPTLLIGDVEIDYDFRNCRHSEADAYQPSPPDPVLAELNRVAAAGATARQLEQATKVSKYRVSKRLKELLDARLVTKSGPVLQADG
jgi:hypothetical protein